MSLLDNFPHECTIQRRTFTKDELGGVQSGRTVEQTGVLCWQQQSSAEEIQEYAKRGIQSMTKVFFLTDPNVTERHEILITKRFGVAVPDPQPLDVVEQAYPDATAGLGTVFKVMLYENTGASK